MLKYEEKLHFDKYYSKMQSDSLPHKILSLIWGIAGYVILYYFMKYILHSIPDFQPWSSFKPWVSWGGVRFIKADFVYFMCGLFLTCYGTIKLTKITVQNHSVRDEKNNTPKELLVSGYYAKVRHPMYGTFIILQAGFMLSLRSLDGIIIALILIAVQYVNAAIEEKRQLIPIFGEEYKLYIKNVGRMLLTNAEIIALVSVALLSVVGFVFRSK